MFSRRRGGVCTALGVLFHVAFASRLAAQHPTMADTAMKTGMVPEPLGVAMDRMGSGTTWIPDAVPLPSRHFTSDAWDMMLHGFVFGEYDKQGGPRGDSQFGSLNWGMFMASHELGGRPLSGSHDAEPGSRHGDGARLSASPPNR